MPFGITNSPPFYSAMMSDLKDEWDKLLFMKVKALKYIDSKVADFLEMCLEGRKITHEPWNIINDILLYCINLTLIFMCLECICIFFGNTELPSD